MLLRESRGAGPPDSGRSLFGLVEDLIAKTARLFDQKLMLLRLEVEEGVATLLRHMAILVGGGVVAGIGLVLVSIACGLWIGALVGSVIAGFALTGLAFLLVGIVVIAVRLRLGVGPKRIVPERTMKELGKDTRWIRNGP